MKLTVGQYQKIHEVAKSNIHETDKMTEMVSAITGKENSEIEEMSTDEFNSLGQQAVNILHLVGADKTLKRYIKVNGKSFKVITNPNLLSALCYSKVANWLKKDNDAVIENLHTFAALVVRPVKDYKLFKIYLKRTNKQVEQTAEVMKDASFDEVHAIAFYYKNLWNSTLEYFRPQIIEQAAKHTTEPEAITDLAIETLKL